MEYNKCGFTSCLVLLRSYERNGLSTDGYLKWYPPLLQNYVSNIISVDGHLIWYLALLKDYVR